ncbi:MAG: hypothetical protein ACRDM1_14805 [Gaiellaceae bacterium]
MWTLAAKLVLTPTIVVATSLAGRRYGAAISGWLVGLPLMSGPTIFFFAAEHGKRFAARAGVGSLSGTLGEAAFCLGWAGAARRRSWPASVLAGSFCFAAVGLGAEALPLDQHLPVPLLPLAIGSLLVLVLALRLLPHLEIEARPSMLAPRWELPARAVVATGILLLLTGLATVLGARLSGLLTVYPLYTAVLAGFAQRNEGPAAAIRVLRGLLLGLFSFVVFFFTLSSLLPRTTIAAAFAAALVLTLTVHAASLWPLRRARRGWSPAPATGHRDRR